MYPARGIRKFLFDLFKGPDGETWAIGRIYSIPLLASGLAVPFVAIYKGQAISFTDLGIYVGAVVGAITALISLTNHVDNPVPNPPTEKKP